MIGASFRTAQTRCPVVVREVFIAMRSALKPGPADISSRRNWHVAASVPDAMDRFSHASLDGIRVLSRRLAERRDTGCHTNNLREAWS